MGRAPCCSKVGLRRGPWTAKEDNLLIGYIRSHGEGHWRSLPKKAGLLRCGKSCRLRWMNYLRPDIKRGNITPDEEDLIIRLHSLLGNRWSLIAGRLPGRTDNEIKNHWNSHLRKRVDNAGSSIIDKRHSFSANDKHPKGTKARKTGVAKKAEETSETTANVKVHQPKATRISHSLSAAVCLNMSHSSNIQPGMMISTLATCEGLMTDMTLEGSVAEDNIDGNGMDPLIIRPGCCNDILSSYSPWRNDIDQILSPGATSSNREMLEKIFEEYQELLTADDHVQLESFADSLLIQ